MYSIAHGTIGGEIYALDRQIENIWAFTINEICQHNNKNDCWIIINNYVYDVTEFLSEHPDGIKSILLFAGKDATDEYILQIH